MLRLKNLYENKSALVIMGGPSILEKKMDLGRIDKSKYTIFLETKALTPRFLQLRLDPDFYLMCFPEKCKDNTLQNFIFRSFLAGTNIKHFIKKKFHYVLEDMRNDFDTYFELWNPHKGPHKKFRWKPDVYMKDSPYDLISQLSKTTKIIANRGLLEQYFPSFDRSREVYFFEQSKNSPEQVFDLEKYYSPVESDGSLILYRSSFLNSASIALYPLLHFMGFKKVYFLGMDMSMLGAFEYSACYTFKSMFHFQCFFRLTKHVFNSSYQMNRPYYFRPKTEFEDFKIVTSYEAMQFVHVYNKFKFAAQIPFLKTITFEELLNSPT